MSPFVVHPGDDVMATILGVDGFCAVIRFTRPGTDAVDCTTVVRLGSVAVVPGYEGEASRVLAEHFAPGDAVRVTWIGRSEDGLPAAYIEAAPGLNERTFLALMAGKHNGARSVDQVLLSHGLAVPTGSLDGVYQVRNRYDLWLRDGAQSNLGAWADASAHMRESSKAWMTSDSHGLHPTFFAANPGFCILIALGLMAGLAVLSMGAAPEERKQPAPAGGETDPDASASTTPKRSFVDRIPFVGFVRMANPLSGISRKKTPKP